MLALAFLVNFLFVYFFTSQLRFHISRVVQEAVQDELKAAMLQRMQRMQVGGGFEEGTQMGPCINGARVTLAQVPLPLVPPRGPIECFRGSLLQPAEA